MADAVEGEEEAGEIDGRTARIQATTYDESEDESGPCDIVSRRGRAPTGR